MKNNADGTKMPRLSTRELRGRGVGSYQSGDERRGRRLQKSRQGGRRKEDHSDSGTDASEDNKEKQTEDASAEHVIMQRSITSMLLESQGKRGKATSCTGAT